MEDMEKNMENNEFKSYIKKIRLDTPGVDFTTHVMNRIFREESVMEKIKRQPVLGKGFWIIITLFVLLMVTTVIISTMNVMPLTESSGIFGEFQHTGITDRYHSFFSDFGKLPVSIAGILAALSFLIFIDRITEHSRHLTAARKFK